MTEIILLTFIILSVILGYKLYKMYNDYKLLLSQKKSSEVILGQITEQITPFLKNFPYDPKKIRFIGMPIDYIYFGEDEIRFIEVKTGKSRLSKKQTNIKKMILSNKVYWEEIHIPGNNYGH